MDTLHLKRTGISYWTSLYLILSKHCPLSSKMSTNGNTGFPSHHHTPGQGFRFPPHLQIAGCFDILPHNLPKVQHPSVLHSGTILAWSITMNSLCHWNIYSIIFQNLCSVSVSVHSKPLCQVGCDNTLLCWCWEIKQFIIHLEHVKDSYLVNSKRPAG